MFTDIRLGGQLNGWDVAEIFRDRFPTIRVLYASGHSIEPRRNVEGSEFFSKPYRVDDVLKPASDRCSGTIPSDVDGPTFRH